MAFIYSYSAVVLMDTWTIRRLFNNFSVPVSCCNTTSPLANETTCPEIVLDVNDFEIEVTIFSEIKLI